MRTFAEKEEAYKALRQAQAALETSEAEVDTILSKFRFSYTYNPWTFLSKSRSPLSNQYTTAKKNSAAATATIKSKYEVLLEGFSTTESEIFRRMILNSYHSELKLMLTYFKEVDPPTLRKSQGYTFNSVLLLTCVVVPALVLACSCPSFFLLGLCVATLGSALSTYYLINSAKTAKTEINDWPGTKSLCNNLLLSSANLKTDYQGDHLLSTDPLQASPDTGKNELDDATNMLTFQ